MIKPETAIKINNDIIEVDDELPAISKKVTKIRLKKAKLERRVADGKVAELLLEKLK